MCSFGAAVCARSWGSLLVKVHAGLHQSAQLTFTLRAPLAGGRLCCTRPVKSQLVLPVPDASGAAFCYRIRRSRQGSSRRMGVGAQLGYARRPPHACLVRVHPTDRLHYRCPFPLF